jgi:hypothetical protein
LEVRTDTTDNVEGIRWLTVAPAGAAAEIFVGQADVAAVRPSPWGNAPASRSAPATWRRRTVA